MNLSKEIKIQLA